MEKGFAASSSDKLSAVNTTEKNDIDYTDSHDGTKVNVHHQSDSHTVKESAREAARENTASIPPTKPVNIIEELVQDAKEEGVWIAQVKVSSSRETTRDTIGNLILRVESNNVVIADHMKQIADFQKRNLCLLERIHNAIAKKVSLEKSTPTPFRQFYCGGVKYILKYKLLPGNGNEYTPTVIERIETQDDLANLEVEDEL